MDDDPAGGLERLAAAGLAWARVAIGASVWAAPRGAMRLLGFDAGNAQVMSLARLGGTRDLALGGLAVQALSDPQATARIAAVNAGLDALDALAFGLALARREGIDRAAPMGTASAAAAAATGLWVARRARARI